MNLDEALARAQVLMSDEYQQKIDAMAPSARKKVGTQKTAQENLWEQQAFGFSNDTPSVAEQSQYNIPQVQSTNSIEGVDKLPEFLRESFKQTPVNGGYNNYMYSEGPVPLPIGQSKPQVMPQAQAAPVMGGGIDYNYIKYLMETVIKENKMVNETAGPSFRGMRLVEGNKFQFIDSKGNVYEGVLTLKKRAAK